jgi:hypothetical protein
MNMSEARSGASRRPLRSYQGPGPIRSIAWTTLPAPSSDAARKRPPRLTAGARHRPLGDRRAQLVGAAQPGARAGLAEAQVAAEAQRVVRQLLQRAQAGDEEREVRQGRVDRGVGGGGVIGAAPGEGDGGGTGEDGSAHGTSGRERRTAR